MRVVTGFVLCLLPSIASAQISPVQVLHRFTPSAANPSGSLVQVPGGDFYAPTDWGIVRLTAAGQVTEVVHFRDERPVGALTLATDGALYGAALSRRDAANGETIFRFDPSTGVVRTMHTFESTADGRLPLGSLVAVGGSLYGVTQFGPGDTSQPGTIFHVVVATGEFVTDHAFGQFDLPRVPSTPLALGPDGFLYGGAIVGPTQGASVLYRFDPATRAVTMVRELSASEGAKLAQLTAGVDGSLYGAASSGGVENAGTLFRYTPATGIFQRLYSLTPSGGFDGRRPGPLVAGGDGHFYGVTDLANDGLPKGWTLFRLRSGAGGTFTFETLRTLDQDVAGRPTQVRLTLGADGLLYGYAQVGGPTLAGVSSLFPTENSGPPGTGTLFRFDPAAGGPPSNPMAFTVLSAFPLAARWDPSAPTTASDGFLYGLTSAGGPANRGAVYRVTPATGAVTVLGDLPGALTGRTVNSALAQGSDGLLYGISTTSPPSPVERNVVRIDPATGIATTAAAATLETAPAELTRTPAGALYGAQHQTPFQIVQFTNGDQLLPAAQPNGVYALSPVTATSDGAVYTIGRRLIFSSFPSGPTTNQTLLIRLNAASPTGVDEVVLSTTVIDVDRLVEGPGGTLYLGVADTASGTVRLNVDSVNPTSGALRAVCTIPAAGSRIVHVSLGPDSALYGFVASGVVTRLFRCDPATGAVTLSTLPSALGWPLGPLATVGGLLYGAASGAGDGGVIFRLSPGAALPALDTDGDGLPNTWETQYGLDPFSSAADNGPNGDPDGDGRTNAQELAEGTHPRGFVTRLFAEGATGPFFRTRFDFGTLSGEGARVRARFLTDTGSVVATDLFIPPRAHLDVDPATLPGLTHANFSAVIESDHELAVDRTMTWDPTGYGSTLETGIPSASTAWYFAEGSTSGDFALFYLLQNPQTTAVTATVTYLRPFGQAPIVRTYTLPPSSRTTIAVDNEGAELASTDVSAAITSTAPIVAERAMYLSRPGQPFMAGHDSAGVTTPALEWFLAEGATGSFFDMFVLIANPNPTPAAITVEYLLTDGAPLSKTYTVSGQSRLTIWVDDEELPAASGHKPLASTSLSAVVRSTNAVPIIVERTMWWPGPSVTSNFWYEAHNAPGTIATATRWLLGGAEIGGADNADTYILIANPSATAGLARVTLMTDDGGSSNVQVQVPAKSRVTVPVKGVPQPLVPGTRYSVLVESMLDQVPFVVERASYASPGGVQWSRGGDALGAPLP